MSDSEQSGAGRREVAYRVFATEYDDSDFSYSEGDEERAPNYVVTPTGARVNRLFVVGVLTEVEEVSEDVLRARVVDPTGAFVLYAGQYQPDEQAFLDDADPPTFVAVTGKARTFQPEDSDRIFTSVRPESINEVTAETRDRWTVQTAEQTLNRVEQMATTLTLDQRGETLQETLVDSGVDEGLASGVVLALDHYDTSAVYLDNLRETALDAARLVAGQTDEVEPVSQPPNAGGDVNPEALAATTVEPEGAAESGSTPSSTTDSADPATDSTEEVSGEPAAESKGGQPTARAESVDGTPATGDQSAESTPEEAPETEVATGKVDGDVTEDADDIGDFEPGEFELDDEEREEIEEEYGTEFQSGVEVDDPGEADIESPESEPDTEPELADAGTAPSDGEVTGGTDESQEGGATVKGADPPGEAPTEVEEPPDDGADPPDESESGTEDGVSRAETDSDDAEPSSGEDGPKGDVDLEDATIEVMGELDSGDGAGREELLETVATRYGVSPEEVEEAIQEALMDGRCYEPDDATLKPI